MNDQIRHPVRTLAACGRHRVHQVPANYPNDLDHGQLAATSRQPRRHWLTLVAPLSAITAKLGSDLWQPVPTGRSRTWSLTVLTIILATWIGAAFAIGRQFPASGAETGHVTVANLASATGCIPLALPPVGTVPSPCATTDRP